MGSLALMGAGPGTAAPVLNSVNLCPNGSFEHDTNGAAVAGWTKNSGTLNMIAANAGLPVGAVGTQCAQIGNNASEIWQYQQTTPSAVSPSTSYTVSAPSIQIASNATGWRFQIQWLDASQVLISTSSGVNQTSGGNGSTATFSLTAASPANAAFARIIIDHSVADIAQFKVDAINFAPAAQGTIYHDGDTGGGWIWTGTVGNSVSQGP